MRKFLPTFSAPSGAAGLLLLAQACALPVLLQAQPRLSVQNQVVIVGALTGQHDRRQLALQTRGGVYRIESDDNAVPFEVVDRTESHLLLVFKPPLLLSRAGMPGGELHPIGVDYRFFPTERSLVSAIILDEVDYAVLDNETSALEIEKATKRYRILPVRPERNTVEMICYNFAHPLLRERAVRHALSYALNRERIRRQFLLDRADIARGPLERDSRLFASGPHDFSYSPKTAIALLAEAGWRELSKDRIRLRGGQPLRFRLLFQEGLTLKEQLVRQIKIDWSQIGVEVVPIPVSAAALNDSLQRGRFDAVLLRHRFQEDTASLVEFFGDGTGRGTFSYLNSAYRHTVNLSRNIGPTTEVRPIIMRLQVILNEDPPATFLFHPWLTIHVINAAKFESYLDSEGLPRPFNEWILSRRP